MVLKIRTDDGWLDILPYVKEGGIKWQRNDVDGPNAGRVIGEAKMYRDRIATKIRLDITIRDITKAELKPLLLAIFPEYVTVMYDDPMLDIRTVQMYSNNNPAACQTIFSDGTELWGGIEFPLIER